MFIDSHCHLDRVNLTPYAGRFDHFIAATQAANVQHLLCVCINLESYPAMRQQVAGYPQISISVGVHPNETIGHDPNVEELVNFAQDQSNVAIGETGLDYYRTQCDLSAQQARFRIHIQAARACNKPLIIHSRAAPTDTLRLLREEQAQDVGGVLHCFTEDWSMARAVLDLGFYISFSGIVTYVNANHLREVARRIPIDRLLIETDCPYLTPIPHRIKGLMNNEPQFVATIASCIAEVRSINVNDIAQATTENFFRLFRAARHQHKSIMEKPL